MPAAMSKLGEATAEGMVVIKRLLRGSIKGLGADEQSERNMRDLMAKATLEHQQQQQGAAPVEQQQPEAPAAVPPVAADAVEAVQESAAVPACAAEVKPAPAAPAAKPEEEPKEEPYVPGTNPALEGKICDLEMNLAACSAMIGKLAHSISPWDIKSHTRQVLETKGQFDSARGSIKLLLQQLLKEAAYTQDAGPKLRERETLLELTKDQEAALQRTAQAHAGNAAKYRAMLMKIDQGKLTRLESRGAAGGRFVATSGDETLTMLSESVDVLVEEHTEVLQIAQQLERTREDLTKRVKELQDKMRNDLEVRDREIQQLKAAVRKASEDKEAGIKGAKDQASTQVSKRTTELKSLQHRAEVSKTEADQAKTQAKALKAALDKATEALEKSQEEVKAANRKMQMAKSQKDSVARELEHARGEQNTLAGELRQLQAAAGPVKCAASYLNKDAGWPRVAFTLRGGKVLHSSACGNMDTSKCTTFEYFSAEDLEGYMQREGCVLCHTCRADPRF